MAGMQYGHYSLQWGKDENPAKCDMCGKIVPLYDFGDCKKYVCDDCEINWKA